MEYLKLIPGYRTALLDGTMVSDSPQHMATEEIYHAFPGSRICLQKHEYMFAVAIFSLERNPDYIYNYAYQQEENWSTYTQNLTPESYGQEEYTFDRECYFRVCLKRKDGNDIGPEDIAASEQALAFFCDRPEYCEKRYFTEEIQDTINKIHRADNEAPKICLLADTHYTINGTWEDTAHNIRRVAENVNYDAIVHLGDLTDGMLSKQRTRCYVERILADLDQCGVPVYITPGNHDSNYFRNAGNAFTREEMKELYRLYGCGEELDYFVDIPEYGVRMIFLSSFDNSAPIRYGYQEHQLKWLDEVMGSAASGTKFLVFSHDAPLAKLDYWSFYIRNGEALLDVLEKYNAREEYQIIGFFYGHTHADYVFEECSFPVISIGCAKLEYFTDKKPEDVNTWPRKADDVTQDLWDSVLIDFEHQTLQMIRFGAGMDREVSFAKKQSTYKQIAKEKRMNRKTKIWAHRGASAHAPENTLPAFRLAEQLGANGIELDVQLTKDGVPVVIHDEKIDRVCDGTGMVKDYTLEELQEFNAAKRFSAYGKVKIPTLAAVYEWVKDTDLEINLELKNSVIFYEGLEEKVLKLAEEYGLEDRIVYSSFNHYSMKKLKQLAPEAKIAFLYSNGIMDVAEYAEKHQAYAIHPSMKNMEYSDNTELVKLCHAHNIKLNVWTVNETIDIERMRAMGVDAVITNFVERG